MKTAMRVLAFLLPAIAVFSSCPAMPPVERMELPNGLTLLVFEDRSLPAVSLRFLVPAGSRRDPRDMQGLANLTIRSVLLGTRTLSFEQINNRLDFLGATLDVECRKDFSGLGMQVLKKDLDSGFGLLFDCICSPSFPESEVLREKDNILGKIKAREDQPIEIAGDAFEKALFAGGPYAAPVEGTEQSLGAVPPSAPADFYASFYAPGNSILVVGGDVSLEEVKTRIVPKLLEWRARPVAGMKSAISFAKGTTSVAVDKPVTQATIVMGCPGVKRSDPDYYPLVVMNNILGSGNLSSRLMREVRVKAGLAYAVESLVFSRKDAGSIRVVLQTKNESAKEATALAIREIERLRSEPVSESELETAKKYLTGSFALRYAKTQQDYAKFLAQVEFFGLGGRYPEQYPSLINAVSAEDVLRAARRYLDLENWVSVTVADLEKAGMK